MDLEGVVNEMTKRYEKIVIIPDTHCPYEDYRALDKVYSFISDYKPDEVVMLGDHVDFYAISRFDKNPERLDSLQTEIDVLHYHLGKLREVHKGKITYLNGNHEARLISYMWKHPEIASLRKMKSIDRFLELDKFGVELKDTYIKHKFLFKHGDIVRNQGAYTARGEFDAEGMSGMSGHCFDEQTELLTKRGWIKGFELLASDEVMTMNKKTHEGEWNKINEFFEYSDYKELIRITSPTTDLLVTDKHGLIFETRNGKQKELKAYEMIELKDRGFFFNAIKEKRTWKLSEDSIALYRLLINIVTDGSYDNGSIRWHLKKQRKIDHLRKLLTLLNVEYSEKVQKNGNTKFRISSKHSKNFIYLIGKVKKLGKWALNIPPSVLLDEYSITDGCKNSASDNSYQISSAKEEEIDLLQRIFVTNGYRATKNNRDSGQFTLTVNTRNGCWLTKNNVSIEEYNGKVWCVNVKNGTLLVRRNGKVTVTLNTHRLGAHYRTNRSGSHAWYEMGHLCSPEAAEYMENKVPNWQQGFGVMVYDKKKDIWAVYQIPIVNNTFIAFDKTYTWRDNEKHEKRELLK